MKKPFRMPRDNTPSDWKRQEDIHDVAKRATSDEREAHVKEAYDRFCAAPEQSDMPDEIKRSSGAVAVFNGGFDTGEAYGHTIGFSRGAREAIGGLTVSKGRSQRFKLSQGNELMEPSTKLDALNEEQLTAEVANLLAQYAIVPTDFKVRAVLDALNALPGVNIRFKDYVPPYERK